MHYANNLMHAFHDQNFGLHTLFI